jgi:hypothetical protein
MNELNCWNCGASLEEIPRPISRHANCLACHAELHACKLCRHFAPKRATQCMEERAEPPTRKDIANFCEWFEPTAVRDEAASDRNASAKAKLDALFGGSSKADDDAEPTPASPVLSKADAAKAELERLFGKKN